MPQCWGSPRSQTEPSLHGAPSLPPGQQPLTLLPWCYSKSAWAVLAALGVHDSSGHPKGSPSPSLQTGSFPSCLVWKNTLHRSGLQSDSSGSTFKVTVKPGVVQRAPERSTSTLPPLSPAPVTNSQPLLAALALMRDGPC